ncbi:MULTISPECIES: 2-dehydropantoate 2-reductase [unclassified Bradyrhizobium]|uniref:2-dehydropantoate 2-reductase n=1 Tax=unclassified Bradyrhizobium TaxID=2631580 RepID=UPI00211E3E21|nr:MULTISPECIES: 2-dehydropantoate 2-reductase [unclassified Bradyrhizobium]MDD1537205.1 2-dehydropantoate 2-reductase [Bradyrhizobium sp. WBOS8]MDD1586741.1 2-dehydropantoate 2-reductase [Bradyrhizobium sp. WBOS4]UUO46676.1 2-dehydropantoate 2-reductase [Bradyrhizobium sp. WBOS04]UUO59533.1 2-dehydropantoate 2-reductase [Bradyrhizobium sp. WBOS08]
MVADRPIVVAGAGAIGCFVGGMLAVGGRRVALLVRPRVKTEIERFGLHLTDFDGSKKKLSAGQLALSENLAIFHNAGIVLVTVKSADTAAIADQIAQHAPEDAVIVSLQNGIGNVAVLRERLGGRRVLAGMVPFNVIAMGEGRFHRSTSGDIHIGEDAANTAAALSVPGLAVRASADITGVQWGKLIINLNNALSALSDMPLAAQLANRDWRRLFADQMAEGLAALKAAGIAPVSSTPIPMSWSPTLLRLPDAIFSAILGRTMKIDPEARSSMWQDLKQGRKTEIDYLQGAVIALAEQNHVEVPLMRRIVALIREAEAAGNGPPRLTPQQIRGGT